MKLRALSFTVAILAALLFALDSPAEAGGRGGGGKPGGGMGGGGGKPGGGDGGGKAGGGHEGGGHEGGGEQGGGEGGGSDAKPGGRDQGHEMPGEGAHAGPDVKDPKVQRELRETRRACRRDDSQRHRDQMSQGLAGLFRSMTRMRLAEFCRGLFHQDVSRHDDLRGRKCKPEPRNTPDPTRGKDCKKGHTKNCKHTRPQPSCNHKHGPGCTPDPAKNCKHKHSKKCKPDPGKDPKDPGHKHDKDCKHGPEETK